MIHWKCSEIVILLVRVLRRNSALYYRWMGFEKWLVICIGSWCIVFVGYHSKRVSFTHSAGKYLLWFNSSRRSDCIQPYRLFCDSNGSIGAFGYVFIILPKGKKEKPRNWWFKYFLIFVSMFSLYISVLYLFYLNLWKFF